MYVQLHYPRPHFYQILYSDKAEKKKKETESLIGTALPLHLSGDFQSVIILKFRLLNFRHKSMNISPSANEDPAMNSLMAVIMTQ